MFGSNNKNTILRQSQVNVDRYASPSIYHFAFEELATEIVIRILVLATTSSASWKTYKSLILVSRNMQMLVYEACLSHLPIMLHTRKHVDSFRDLLASHPTTVGPHVRNVWFIAGIKADAERALGLDILNKCNRITHMACTINLLKTLVGSSAAFAHHDLKHLTLIEPVIPWDDLLSKPAGRELFTQLTRFRASGGTKFIIPEFSFSSLTHLSFTCHELTSRSISASSLDAAHFPALQQIVPSLPYMACRTKDPNALRVLGLAIDSRIGVIACPKKWKEADIWEEAKRGGKDLWLRAKSDEYLQKSRAFTQAPPTWGSRSRAGRRYYDYDFDFDDEGYEFGGETGL